MSHKPIQFKTKPKTRSETNLYDVEHHSQIKLSFPTQPRTPRLIASLSGSTGRLSVGFWTCHSPSVPKPPKEHTHFMQRQKVAITLDSFLKSRSTVRKIVLACVKKITCWNVLYLFNNVVISTFSPTQVWGEGSSPQINHHLGYRGHSQDLCKVSYLMFLIINHEAIWNIALHSLPFTPAETKQDMLASYWPLKTRASLTNLLLALLGAWPVVWWAELSLAESVSVQRPNQHSQ